MEMLTFFLKALFPFTAAIFIVDFPVQHLVPIFLMIHFNNRQQYSPTYVSFWLHFITWKIAEPYYELLY